ncbi:hypothetical protein THRCLA_21217 [Thraustotheca clavata]|uniref:Transmembrane protein n=1 Tax=Thraustotheca clavata TaxID=74557 RepID=A0A1V9ZYV2_9STRA|nr:hypothetical protein THRCLA_21217 [Thraustotheca clavata]
MARSTQVTPLGPATPTLPSFSLNFEKSWVHVLVGYASFLLGICIVLLLSMDTVVNNWSINDFVGDGYAFLTPIATVQSAEELNNQYNFASNWGLNELSKVGYWMVNSSVNAFVTKSNSIFVVSVGWFPMASGSQDQCKIFQTSYPLDLSQTPNPRLALASNLVTYYRGNALTHYFSNDRTVNVATAPISSSGLDDLGYTPGRIGVDMRLTTKIPLVNTSSPQEIDVTFYKFYPKSICTGCSTVTELGFGHCNLTFIYNDTTKRVKITNSNNILGTTYKFGLLIPQSLFSSASHYVKVIAIIFAVGGFLASRRTAMWLEVDRNKTDSILAKILRMILPKYFPYPSHALRFDMFCYNSDIFSIFPTSNEYL